MYDLMDGIAAGTSPVPTFEDGYRCQAVLDTVERSAESRERTRPAILLLRSWCEVPD
ncbi:MAG TPA: hypothetical protein VK361_10945 [Rubrobacteraceae bacterium]|nr:hypothetical protein [Rubrobacteraceae bacterium]